MDVGGVQQDDRLAVITRLLEQLARLGLALGHGCLEHQGLGAILNAHSRTTGEVGAAGAVVVCIANGSTLDVFLVDRQLRCLAGRQVVERRVQVIEPYLPNIAQLAQYLGLHARCSHQGRQNVDGRHLEEIYFARHQRRGCGLSVRDDVPDDLVEKHPLAAGNARGWLAARHVVGVALIHHAAARPVL